MGKAIIRNRGKARIEQMFLASNHMEVEKRQKQKVATKSVYHGLPLHKQKRGLGYDIQWMENGPPNTSTGWNTLTALQQ